MKVVCFNVNGIRARLHQLDAVKQAHNPTVIGLQEVKVSDEEFPFDAVACDAYPYVETHGQKGHYGVALVSQLPFKSVSKGFATDDDGAQRRFIFAIIEHPELGDVIVMNGYFPQGDNRNHPTKWDDKQRFYANLGDLLEGEFSPEQNVILMGDMNVSHQDIDIAIGEQNAKRWLRTGKCSFQPEERNWLNRLFDWGFIDTFRQVHGETTKSSWFDYRSKGFDDTPKRGLRIDLIMASTSLSKRLDNAGIDHDIRAMEKPSDHCPIWASFV